MNEASMPDELTKEQIALLASSVGAVSYSPPPMRAVRGMSFTFEQLEAFVAALRSSRSETLEEAARVCEQRATIYDLEATKLFGVDTPDSDEAGKVYRALAKDLVNTAAAIRALKDSAGSAAQGQDVHSTVGADAADAVRSDPLPQRYDPKDGEMVQRSLTGKWVEYLDYAALRLECAFIRTAYDQLKGPQEEPDYVDCPIHGKMEGTICPRC